MHGGWIWKGKKTLVWAWPNPHLLFHTPPSSHPPPTHTPSSPPHTYYHPHPVPTAARSPIARQLARLKGASASVPVRSAMRTIRLNWVEHFRDPASVVKVCGGGLRVVADGLSGARSQAQDFHIGGF